MNTIVARADFINSLIGKRFAFVGDGPDAYDCYHLWRRVLAALADYEAADIDLPPEYDVKWVVRKIVQEMKNWQLITPHPIVGYAEIPDCTTVLMSGNQRLHHIGTWLKPEQGIIHVDEPDGVVLYPYPQLKRMYGTMVFLRPITESNKDQ